MTKVLTKACPVTNRFADLKPADLNAEEKEMLIALAISILKARHRRGQPLESPHTTRTYLQLQCADYRHEVFGCLFLDTRNRVVEHAELFRGSIDSATVHPRVVVQRALEVNAAAIVVFHNHPSGVAEPSRADRALTRRLADALGLVDIRLIDHLVIGESESVSFAERGWL